MKRTVPALICCIACALIAGAGLAAEKNDGSTLTKVGDRAPKFTLTTLDGKTVGSETIKGKVTVVNFFATWCGPCLQKLPQIEEEVWNRFKKDDRFAMVVVGREHTRDELVAFKTDKKLTLPFAPDPGRKMYSRFATQWIPRVYVIDGNGKIVFQSIGNDPAEFKQMLKTIQQSLDALGKREPKETRQSPIPYHLDPIVLFPLALGEGWGEGRLFLVILILIVLLVLTHRTLPARQKSRPHSEPGSWPDCRPSLPFSGHQPFMLCQEEGRQVPVAS